MGLLSVNGGYPMVNEGGGYSIILEAEVTQQSVMGWLLSVREGGCYSLVMKGGQ